MARLQLNKSSLAKQAKDLESYERFLPSLDLKRQQLMGEKAKADKELVRIEHEIAMVTDDFGNKLPMLSNMGIDLTGLVAVKDAEYGEENIVGTHLPTLETIEVEVKPYSYLAMPHWVDSVVKALHDALELQLKRRVQRQRVEILEAAVKTITQRVNLFDKVLIPQAKANIKTIKIYLSDEQMASVVRSKIAKRKRANMVAAS